MQLLVRERNWVLYRKSLTEHITIHYWVHCSRNRECQISTISRQRTTNHYETCESSEVDYRRRCNSWWGSETGPTRRKMLSVHIIIYYSLQCRGNQECQMPISSKKRTRNNYKPWILRGWLGDATLNEGAVIDIQRERCCLYTLLFIIQLPATRIRSAMYLSRDMSE